MLFTYIPHNKQKWKEKCYSSNLINTMPQKKNHSEREWTFIHNREGVDKHI
jgi:hypothetical protein